MKLSAAHPLIDAALACAIPVVLRGDPGIGKTATLTALAEARGMLLEVVLASIREPADFAGLPVVADDGSTRFAPPSWARTIAAHDGAALVLFDEVSTAPPAVQAALLRVITEGVVGDLRLPASTRFVAAMNPVESAAGGYDLEAPLANRLFHLDVAVDASFWANGMLTGWREAVGPVLSVEPTPEALAASTAAVCGFIAANPNMLSAVPSEPSLAGGPWPSPRTWDYLTRLLPRIPATETEDLSLAAASGLVGTEAAARFLTYRAEIDLPAVGDVLADPAAVDWSDRRADRLVAILNSVVAFVTENPAQWDAAHDTVRRAVIAGRGDVAATVMARLASAKPTGSAIDPVLLAAFAPLLERAGKVS